MSSHHFVRQQQTSALYILGPCIRTDLLDQLLEWNPLVITTAEMAEWCRSVNIKIDVIIGGEQQNMADSPYVYDNWTTHEIAEIQGKISEEGLASDLILIDPGVADTSELCRRMLEGKYADTTIYQDDKKFFKLSKGRELKKWMPAGSRFLLYPPEGAKVGGPLTCTADFYVLQTEGTVLIEAMDNIIFVEYI